MVRGGNSWFGRGFSRGSSARAKTKVLSITSFLLVTSLCCYALKSFEKEEGLKAVQDERIEAMMELISLHIESKHRHEHLGKGIKGFMKDRTWEGNSHIGVKSAQVLDYVHEIEKYARQHGKPLLICEVGLNGGHSAAAMLLAAGKESTFVSFDIGNFGPVTYYNTTVTMLQRVFPKQIEFILGDSAITVPLFAAQRGKVCDVVSVDGDHSKEGALRDINSIRTISKSGALVLMDDTNLDGPKSALKLALESHMMSKIRCVEVDKLRVPRAHRRSVGEARVMRQGWCFLRLKS